MSARRFALFCLLGFAIDATGQDSDLKDRVDAILDEVPLIDGHNDLPSSILDVAAGDIDRVDISRVQVEMPADVPRLREGRVSGQFWSAFVHTSYMLEGDATRQALREIDMVHRLVERYPELVLATRADDIVRAHASGNIASMIGIEGGHAIEGSLATLRMFHRLGARYMTLTHFLTHEWADSATDFPRHGGLTEFGEAVVREMNRLGMFVDLSHVSAETMKDALRVSRAPVIYSHSNARAVSAHPRNVPDDVLELVAENGGVVMVNFIPGYVVPTPDAVRLSIGIEAGRFIEDPVWSIEHEKMMESLRAELDDPREIERRAEVWLAANPPPRGTLSDVCDHIDHIRGVAGIDHVGIGSDFYDAGGPSMAEGLEDVTKFPAIVEELLKRGYSDDDVKKIVGMNLLRAMREMERVANALQEETLPSLRDLKPIGAR